MDGYGLMLCFPSVVPLTAPAFRNVGNVHTFRTGVEVIPIFPSSRKRTFGIFTPKNNENGYGKTYSV